VVHLQEEEEEAKFLDREKKAAEKAAKEETWKNVLPHLYLRRIDHMVSLAMDACVA
jgi:hypothetical protein